MALYSYEMLERIYKNLVVFSKGNVTFWQESQRTTKKVIHANIITFNVDKGGGKMIFIFELNSKSIELCFISMISLM